MISFTRLSGTKVYALDFKIYRCTGIRRVGSRHTTLPTLLLVHLQVTYIEFPNSFSQRVWIKKWDFFLSCNIFWFKSKLHFSAVICPHSYICNTTAPVFCQRVCDVKSELGVLIGSICYAWENDGNRFTVYHMGYTISLASPQID
jgi:hypothetical protein